MRAVKAVAEGPAIPAGRSAKDNASQRMKIAFGFALVGASGILVNQAALWLLVSYAGIYYAVAAIIATMPNIAPITISDAGPIPKMTISSG